MFSVVFDTEVVVSSTSELRSRFSSENIELMPGSSVTFEGQITIGAGVIFAGVCRFGDKTRIENGSMLTSVIFGNGNIVRAYSIISDTVAGIGNLFGPFCFIRDGCIVGSGCILGAHVETARSHFGSGVKISHRAFVGDAEVGEQTIIGAGVVFCNFDGQGRQQTVVGSGVTVGSGALLVPPLTIGDNSLIGAGSIVTKDLPAATRFIQRR